MNVIVERQSPDWGNPDLNLEDAAQLLADRLCGSPVQARNFATATRALHALWDECFPIPLSACRHFLKEVAHESWRSVIQCDGIVTEPRHGFVSESVFGTPGWILFTDDDDWYAPDIFVNIAALEAPDHSPCVLWQRVRFDGMITTSPIEPSADSSLYAYTNNYAVRSDHFQRGIRVASVMQHSYANGQIQARKWSFTPANQGVWSLTNKSPCSWNYLTRARRAKDPKKELLQLVNHYAWTAPVSEPRLRWCEPLILKCQQFFRDLLGRRTVPNSV